MPAARWTETAVDLSETPGKVADYLGLDQVCAAVKLSPATVEDSLLRPPIDDPTNPRGAICRPAARIGGTLRPTPLWAPYQVEDYKARKAARSGVKATKRKAQTSLPEISPEDAGRRGLALVEQIAARMGLAENTVRRFARDYRSVFPEVIAIAPREGARHFGPPKEYRDYEAVRTWIERFQAEHSRHPAADAVPA